MAKAFWIWLGVMIPLVAVLTIVGYSCESCIAPLELLQ